MAVSDRLATMLYLCRLMQGGLLDLSFRTDQV